MLIFISSFLAAIVISFLCSLVEAAILSVTPGEIATLSQKHPRIGKIWTQFKKAIDQPILVVLVINTAAHTMGATIAGAKFEEIWPERSILWFSVSFTLAILFFTEILPKSLGVEYRIRLAQITAVPLRALIKFMLPLTFLSSLINRPFTRRRGKDKTIALEELRSLAAFARVAKEIGYYQEKIIQEASQLSQKRAEEIMIPAEEIVYFDAEASLEDLIVKAHLDPHTRFPVIRQHDINQIQGYINFKELLFLARSNPNAPTLQGIIRPIHFVAPQTALHHLLRIFVEEHIHIAVVQSNEEKTLGLVSLEDVIEEFLGDIEDEFDRLPKMAHALSGGTWMVGGGIPWNQLAKRLQIPLEHFPGNLSDWLLEHSEGPLKTGDILQHEGLQFIVRRMRRGRVFEVTLVPLGSTLPPNLPRHGS